MTPCLDHQPTRDANGKPRPAVTGKHYNYAPRKNMEAKRKVLDRWAAEPRRIVGTPSWQSRPGSRRPPAAARGQETRPGSSASATDVGSSRSAGRQVLTVIKCA